MELSVSFFGSTSPDDVTGRFDLVGSVAQRADDLGFRAVWLPERHLAEFGGLFPNPAVVAASLSASTRHIAIRAGSVVLPLHHPLRVAEEWSVVDNLSAGRAGISFASGWHPDDFVIAREPFDRRTDRFLEDIATVQALWRGATLDATDADGLAVKIRCFPQPVQPELPTWLTTGGSAATASTAGARGLNLLTHLLRQSDEGLAQLIETYRAARRGVGLDPSEGIVTVMVHTFAAASTSEIAPAREALRSYVGTSLDLSQRTISRGSPHGGGLVSDEDRQALLDHSTNRHLARGMIGTLSTCSDRLGQLAALGVNEVACLVDFGLPDEAVLDGLGRLADLIARGPNPVAGPRAAEQRSG